MKHSIELNGKHYDVLTGELINHGHKSRQNEEIIKPETSRRIKSSPAPRTHRPVAIAAAHHKVKRSRTLMRAGLSRPSIIHASHSMPKANNTIKTIAQLHRDSARLTRASKIQQSKFISRFGSLTGQSTYSHQQ